MSQSGCSGRHRQFPFVKRTATPRKRFSTSEFLGFGWEVLKGIGVAVAALLSFWANQSANEAKVAIDAARVKLDEQGQQYQVDLKVYELVERAIAKQKADDDRQERAAAAMVESLTREPLRSDLKNVLRAHTVDQELIKQIDRANQFDAEDALPVKPQPGAKMGLSGFTDLPLSSAFAQTVDLKAFHLDILYCESRDTDKTEERRIKAEEFRNALGGTANIRVRLLPTLVQARRGYQSASNEVRARIDQPDDLAAAKLISTKLRLEQATNLQIDARRKSYLLILVCA